MLAIGMSILWQKMGRQTLLSDLFPRGTGKQALQLIFTWGSDSICTRIHLDSYRCCTGFRVKINVAELELELVARVVQHCMSIWCRVFCVQDRGLEGYLKIAFSLLNFMHTIHMAITYVSLWDPGVRQQPGCGVV